MALVFKIKFQDTLRRWVVSEDFNLLTFCLTFSQLEDKIRDLFHLSHTTTLLLTYVDKENDVVALEDDQDLVDACLVQELNPLRLDVHEKLSTQEPRRKSLICFTGDDTAESVWKMSPADTTSGKNQSVSKLELKHSSGYSLRDRKNLAGSVVPRTPALPNYRAYIVDNLSHHGVQCDGCGMHPIEGPRYKSSKIQNYDLCGSCFDSMGTSTDFEKLDYPETCPQHSHGHVSLFERGVGFRFLSVKDSLLKALSRCTLASTSRPFYTPDCPFSGQTVEFSSMNEDLRKFDARFIEDVTFSDGAELEPATQFTKIWRMQNNGTLPWPQGTQLAHIRGSTLSLMEVVQLELPEGGLACGQEVDVCVDLGAPNIEGRFVSHWRLMLPSGQLFGHTVWVVIQVKSKLGKLNVEVSHRKEEEKGKLNMKVSQSNEGQKRSPLKTIYSSPGLLEGNVNSSVVLPLEERSLLLETETDIELDGFSFVEKPVENIAIETDSEVAETNFDTQMKLLESMGFENRDSNRFWLERNNASMESTLKDIIMDAGWEDKIKNLNEMGFNDQKSNVQLLHKHSGSIKLVVKDLVKMEREANREDTL
ncbi:hypothetical protein L7F22_050124 [Adiantum nelumboides]|nr:hypothetical protein [Adiantum nelumboides]